MTKMRQAVRWMLEDPTRTQSAAARMFGVNQGNLSKAIRDARSTKRLAGEMCPCCGQLYPTSRDKYAAPVAPAHPAQVAPVPGFVPVRPAQTEAQIAADINAYYAEHGAELCKPEPMSEVQRFIMERDARLGMQDPAVTPRVPDELRGVIKDD